MVGPKNIGNYRAAEIKWGQSPQIWARTAKIEIFAKMSKIAISKFRKFLPPPQLGNFWPNSPHFFCILTLTGCSRYWVRNIGMESLICYNATIGR